MANSEILQRIQILSIKIELINYTLRKTKNIKQIIFDKAMSATYKNIQTQTHRLIPDIYTAEKQHTSNLPTVTQNATKHKTTTTTNPITI